MQRRLPAPKHCFRGLLRRREVPERDEICILKLRPEGDKKGMKNYRAEDNEDDERVATKRREITAP